MYISPSPIRSLPTRASTSTISSQEDVCRRSARPSSHSAFGWATVLRGEESLGGGEPAFFATTILSFADEEAARNAVASDAAKALVEDIANFTSVTPVVQFNTAVR